MTCFREIIFSLVCTLPRPDAPEPMHFGYGKAVNRAVIAASFIPQTPDIGPVIAMKPAEPVQKRPQQRRDERPGEGLAVLTSYAPTRSAGKVWKGQGNLFVLSDGNEQTGCLHKDKRLYSAMKKIRAHFGKPLVIESAYRSKAYNAALRKRSKRVAKNSYHIRCAAIDFRISGVQIKTIARYAATLPEVGGIGTYRTWVHLDSRERKNGRITFW